MPDWSYHLLFKPVLKRIPTYYSREFIHRGMNTIASVPGGKGLINFLGREESDPRLQKEIDGITFPNSIGLSGKIDPLLTGTNAFSNLGFGFLEIGPVTISERDGNIPEVNEKEQYIIFPEKIGSIGLEKTVEKLRNNSYAQPIFVRVNGTASEVIDMMTELEPFADAYIVDHEILKKLPELHIKKPLYTRFSVHEIPSNVDERAHGIILEEVATFQDYENRTLLIDAVEQLRYGGFSKTMITVGGIIEPNDAIDLFHAGADLVMLSGGYVFSGPGLPKRIKEQQVFENQSKQEPPKKSGWLSYFLFGLAMFIGGLIALILSMTTVILPYDEHFLEMPREVIVAFNERILYFMAHDRMTLAGTMISGSIIYMSLAYFGVRHSILWTKQAIDAASIIGFLGIFLFIGYGYFDWLHLLFWLVLLPFFIVGFMKTKGMKGAPASTNRFNTPTWKRGLIGQLAFVMLGFSFVIGGIIISIIGVTGVFIETDIAYICMPPEMMDAFNERLIPVIAHDRAGFGSALLSVGLLVLLLALWGFQQGNQWIWWTFLIGGIPAFAAGIGVHFAIGYTTFIHLLPAYYALALYVCGLLFSYQFFKKN
ncbi:dihydroorotate dehydrogenase [Evansella cellulosilytica]|uniref:Dihydroorotate oxidase n=1 Tax=Evansella cellulosilytica (strain ATCC 21833 / DSM 2522 / FERM P-1141 / JCM 9156 / N-4) TaxID=649639 RepID=E6U0P0_EVAC2|nr:dihydroorotate dehydrogenase [Evansella cellulosilytica]ADU29088.1 dihydroorotate oxidase [Evansella cellulosilytica DSM 2522]